MKLYNCSNCKNPLYFENVVCLNCKHSVGFVAETLEMISLERTSEGSYNDFNNKNKNYKYCANSVHGNCNWLVEIGHEKEFCLSCDLNRTIPQLSIEKNLRNWKHIEAAKRRLIFTLLKLKLPIQKKQNANDLEGLIFDFLADVSPENRVLTGHADGVITLNIEEADEVERIKSKVDFSEKYRTLLGHFRHEVGHYYWDVLIKNSKWLDEYRQIFGDEQKDYANALETYYQNGASFDWPDKFISAYATSHPWEDWAETWAHYLHLMDTLETAYQFGIGVHPQIADEAHKMEIEISGDPFCIDDFDKILKMWLPLTFAFNSLNRSMGYQDFYPFVIAPVVTEKLKFIHKVCRAKK